jgi:hypothetical protein
MTGEGMVLSAYGSGVGEPSRESDSGVISPLIPTWLGDAGALLTSNKHTQHINIIVTDVYYLSNYEWRDFCILLHKDNRCLTVQTRCSAKEP